MVLIFSFSLFFSCWYHWYMTVSCLSDVLLQKILHFFLEFTVITTDSALIHSVDHIILAKGSVISVLSLQCFYSFVCCESSSQVKNLLYSLAYSYKRTNVHSSWENTSIQLFWRRKVCQYVQFILDIYSKTFRHILISIVARTRRIKPHFFFFGGLRRIYILTAKSSCIKVWVATVINFSDSNVTLFP